MRPVKMCIHLVLTQRWLRVAGLLRLSLTNGKIYFYKSPPSRVKGL